MKLKWVVIFCAAFLGLGFFSGFITHAYLAQVFGLNKIFICDVIYDPPGPEPDNELVRICNGFDEPVDISGWVLTDGEGSYRIPPGTMIQGRGSWKVMGSTYNPTGYTHGLYLANKGDTVTLIDSGGNVVDEYAW